MSIQSARRKGSESGKRHAANGKVCSYDNGVRHAKKAGFVSEESVHAYAQAFARAGNVRPNGSSGRSSGEPTNSQMRRIRQLERQGEAQAKLDEGVITRDSQGLEAGAIYRLLWERGHQHASRLGLISFEASAYTRGYQVGAQRIVHRPSFRTNGRSPRSQASCSPLPGSAQDRLDRAPRDRDGNLLRMRDFDAAWATRGGSGRKPFEPQRYTLTSRGLRANPSPKGEAKSPEQMGRADGRKLTHAQAEAAVSGAKYPAELFRAKTLYPRSPAKQLRYEADFRDGAIDVLRGRARGPRSGKTLEEAFALAQKRRSSLSSIPRQYR